MIRHLYLPFNCIDSYPPSLPSLFSYLLLLYLFNLFALRLPILTLLRPFPHLLFELHFLSLLGPFFTRRSPVTPPPSLFLFLNFQISFHPPLIWPQTREHKIDWQWPLSGIHCIMMVNSAQPGWWGVHVLPFSLYITSSRAKLWCTLQPRGQRHSSYFSSTLFSSVDLTSFPAQPQDRTGPRENKASCEQ